MCMASSRGDSKYGCSWESLKTDRYTEQQCVSKL